MTTFDEIWPKLQRSKEYRDAFVAQVAKQAIGYQVRALLHQYDLSQTELASKVDGLTQGVVSRAADPTYGNVTLNTAVKIANGFDVLFLPLYLPFSELPKWFERIYSKPFEIPTFDVENEEIEAEKAAALAKVSAPGNVVSIKQYEDKLLEKLRGGARRPAKAVTKKPESDLGANFNQTGSGSVLSSAGSNKPLPQSEGFGAGARFRREVPLSEVPAALRGL